MRDEQRFRELMLAAVAKRKYDAIMLSGGTDSATILAALLAAGRKPTVYTFRLGPDDSADSLLARRMAEAHGLKFRLCEIPWNQSTLVRDVDAVLRITRNPTKVHVQCSQPWLYLAPAAVKDGYRSAFLGMSADNLWGTDRDSAVELHYRGEDAYREVRRKNFTDPAFSEHSVKEVAAAKGLELFDPYQDPDLSEFLLSLTSTQMHTPCQKGLAFRAFPEFWKGRAWRRKNAPLQVVSKIREWHDTLLQNPAVNPGKAKAVVAVYNRMLEWINDENKTSF